MRFRAQYTMLRDAKSGPQIQNEPNKADSEDCDNQPRTTQGGRPLIHPPYLCYVHTFITNHDSCVVLTSTLFSAQSTFKTSLDNLDLADVRTIANRIIMY